MVLLLLPLLFAQTAYGEDINTALMFAALGGHTGIVKALLEAGADVNAKNKNGWTASMYAAHEGHAGIVEILKKAGAKE